MNIAINGKIDVCKLILTHYSKIFFSSNNFGHRCIMLLKGFHTQTIIIYVFMTIFDDPIKLNIILHKCTIKFLLAYEKATLCLLLITSPSFNISLFVKLHCIIDSNVFIVLFTIHLLNQLSRKPWFKYLYTFVPFSHIWPIRAGRLI